MDSYKYDGLVIDLEPIEEANAIDLLAFAEALRSARPAMTLGIAVAGDVNINYDSIRPSEPAFWTGMARACDYIMLMTFGMAFNISDWHSWHGSALYGAYPQGPVSVESGVTGYVEKGVPKNKIMVGASFWAQSFGPHITGPRQPLDGKSVSKLLTYNDVIRKYHRPSYERWDDIARVPYLSISPAADGVTYITYENSRSLSEKASYVRAEGLAGVFVWEVSGGPHSLLTHLYKEMN
jgi:chitinase